MTKQKKPVNSPGHKMGKHCGYTLMADGRILPAPNYSDQFRKLSSERHGINDLMKLFTSHCADLLAEIQRRQADLWERLCEDYGLDKTTHDISFDGEYISIKPRSPREESPDSANEGAP